MASERGEPVQVNELEEIRGDIRDIVAKLDRMIGDRSDDKAGPAQT